MAQALEALENPELREFFRKEQTANDQEDRLLELERMQKALDENPPEPVKNLELEGAIKTVLKE